MRSHGIGGFSAAADELAMSHFDLFEKPEYETGIKDFETIQINILDVTGIVVNTESKLPSYFEIELVKF